MLLAFPITNHHPVRHGLVGRKQVITFVSRCCIPGWYHFDGVGFFFTFQQHELHRNWLWYILYSFGHKPTQHSRIVRLQKSGNNFQCTNPLLFEIVVKFATSLRRISELWQIKTMIRGTWQSSYALNDGICLNSEQIASCFLLTEIIAALLLWSSALPCNKLKIMWQSYIYMAVSLQVLDPPADAAIVTMGIYPMAWDL